MGMRLTDEEREYCMENYLTKGLKELADEIGCNQSTIRKIARKCGIIKSRPWTDEELDFLWNNYKKIPLREMSRKLNRSTGTIMSRYCIIKKNGGR